MKRRIIRPSGVEKDLADLAEVIAQNNVSAALRFLDAAEAAFERLAEMPEMGTNWETDNPRLANMRVWSIKGFKKYLIFYRPFADRIEIFHVVHGARDFKNLFGG